MLSVIILFLMFNWSFFTGRQVRKKLNQNAELHKMKTNLSSTNIAASYEKQSINADKSASPSSSPRSSPRPSPRLQSKRDHSKSDTLLTVHYKDHSLRHDGSPSSQESSKEKVNSIEVTPPHQEAKPESLSSSGKERHSRAKKKSWFTSFYPSYKSRSEDFKKLFKEVPDDERLVVDYSCALQKEILVQGRLYVTQNFLCFYANIFGWETNVTLRWKEVAAITKEKTALVIPNAILISTRAERYFFTSFVARDKTYLMLFRVWQNALMDQPMSSQELWQWVHQCYGSELGLTSDDEDYIAPGAEENKQSVRLSVESFSEQEAPPAAETSQDRTGVMPDRVLEEISKTATTAATKRTGSESHLPTDATDNSESELEKADKTESPARCTNSHEGRTIISDVVPVHIDQLFTLLFTSSKFYLDFHAARKTTDLTQTPWTHNPLDGSKSRMVNLTMCLANSMGPKTAQVTEAQTMLPCSKAGQLYSIDIESINAGVPYADSFLVLVHYCLQTVSDTQSSLTVYAQIKYRKSVWGLVKGMIERNCYAGMEEFCNHLLKMIQAESEESLPELKRKTRRKRRLHSMPRCSAEDSRSTVPIRKKSHTEGFFTTDVCTLIVFSVLLLLLFLNILLYYKLWSLEETPPYTLLDLQLLKNPPKNHEEWIRLLQQQEALHSVESQKWQKLLRNSIQLLRQAEESLNELQRSIQTTYTSKVLSILQNQGDRSGDSHKEEL